MDTTQKPRQENQNRRPPDAGTQKRPRPTGEQPPQRPVRETRENREKATEARQPAQLLHFQQILSVGQISLAGGSIHFASCLAERLRQFAHQLHFGKEYPETHKEKQ